MGEDWILTESKGVGVSHTILNDMSIARKIKDEWHNVKVRVTIEQLPQERGENENNV